MTREVCVGMGLPSNGVHGCLGGKRTRLGAGGNAGRERVGGRSDGTGFGSGANSGSSSQ